MNRREFVGKMVGGVAAAAAMRQWPFRVYSFPSEPVLALGDLIVPYTQYFQPGQMIAMYSPTGVLAKGYYRVKHIDELGRRIYLAYEERPQFIGLGRGSGSLWDKGPDGKPVQIKGGIGFGHEGVF